MLTYILFKNQCMLFSATSRKCQPNADLQPIQNQGHAPVNNKQKGPARCWLTYCSKPRACSCEQQAGKATQMLTYILFKTQSVLFSATSRKGQPHANLHPIQNPGHTPISSKLDGPPRYQLTSCSKARACSSQPTSNKGHPDADLLSPIQNTEHSFFNNK